MSSYDVCVIGAGPSGYAAAMRAIDFGQRVCLVEKNKIGGAGIWNGALSSKTLWELSERYQSICTSRYGYQVFDSDMSYSSVVQEMHKAVNDKYSQLKQQLDYFEKKGLITFVKGHASFATPTTISIDHGNGKSSEITATNTILAVGSRPRILPHIQVDGEHIVTSDHIGNLNDFPESIVILGAGVIGCEFATIFSNFGKTKVFLIDKADRILPFEDEDIAHTVAHRLEHNGVHIHKGASLQHMKVVDGMVEYELSYADGRKETRRVEKALISVGRIPNSDQLGLDQIGMELTDRGYCIDNDTQSSIEHIYAVGDFTADIALVNIAELEGRHAVERMMRYNNQALRYDNISTIMFLNPEVASVGMNETQARKKGIAYRLAKLQYKYVNRAIAMRSDKGFIKLIVSDDDEMQILGLRVLGDHASSTIMPIALLISLKKSVSELAELIHPHPSIPEGIQECARMLLGKSIVKPNVFAIDMECYRVSESGEITNLEIHPSPALSAENA